MIKVEDGCWMITGHCKKCGVTICMNLFQQEAEPIQGVDYIFEDKMCEADEEMLDAGQV